MGRPHLLRAGMGLEQLRTQPPHRWPIPLASVPGNFLKRNMERKLPFLPQF